MADSHIEQGHDPETDAMARRSYTILILPSARSRLKKIHVSRNFLFAVGGILLTVLSVGVLAPHFVLKVRSQEQVIDRLLDENRRLREQRSQFEVSLGALSERLGDFERRTVRLASEMGINDLPGARSAAGGGVAGVVSMRDLASSLEEDLDGLAVRADGIDRSLEKVGEAWSERVRVLSATPSGMPVRGFFSHGFGWRNDPFTGEREFHYGVDIVAPSGTEILAPADGIVTRANRMQGYGKMVHLSHGFGMATRYGHLNEVLVRPGQRVSRGDIIGRVGSTGRSTGPHLRSAMQADRG